MTERVSVNSAGDEGNGSSGPTGISADGRYVAFVSWATNLVPGDTNGVADVFVRDRLTGAVDRVSVSSVGEQSNRSSPPANDFILSSGQDRPSLSADGRYVAFTSEASNLVPGDTNGVWDVFVHDRLTGTTQRMSVNSAGDEGNALSWAPNISADGRFVAFSSRASNLVSGDTNGRDDVFVHDRLTGATERVSVDSRGDQANRTSFFPRISADGRFVAFVTNATNLVPGDTNDKRDVFVHDRLTDATERVSVSSTGGQGNYGSGQPSLSADGRYVAFGSHADNLVPGDTNGDYDILVHDRLTGTTERVSVSSTGGQGNGSHQGMWPCDPCGHPSISADGRYVAFVSAAFNLVADDTNGEYHLIGGESLHFFNAPDVFVHDRITGTTERVSVDSAGHQANGFSGLPAISADGRHVAFFSATANLVPDDTNGMYDVFVRALTE